MTNAQLKAALNTLLTNDTTSGQINNVLLEEIRELRKQVADLQGIKQEIQDQARKLDDAFKIISNQQRFLEAMNGRERRLNLVITDEDKVRNVIEATGYCETFNSAVWELKRLGQQDDRKRRPLLAVVEDGRVRNEIVKGAKNLKSVQGPWSRVYLKKDVHPVIRQEMARLRTREREETDQPANAGRDVTTQRRVLLLIDDNIIDRFCPYFT